MKALIALSLGTLIGAGALGVMGGLKAKDEIVNQRLQATEDSIAALALANSEAALADSLGGELPESGEPATATDEVGPTSGGDGGGGGASADEGPEPASQSATPPPVPSAVPSAVPEAGSVTPTQAAADEQAAAEASAALAKETGDRLSKIFSQMKPGEAADVLSYLSDGEIERILLGIRERDAAAILAQLDPERAAAVSRRVLRPGGGG